MSIGKTQLIDFMRRILASDDTVRDVAADEVTDISSGLTKSEAECLSVALVVARLNEESADCQEAQLNALADLAASQQLAGCVREMLAEIMHQQIDPSQREHLRELLVVDSESK